VRIGIACEAGPPPSELLDLLEAAGLPAASVREETPPALLPTAGVVWLLGSATDVLRACDRGGLDLAIVGRDRLLEGRRGTGELFDLGCCRDDLVFAGTAAEERPGRRLRVATRHPETARRHFAAAGVQPEIITMDAPALAPALGLADGVVVLSSCLASGIPGSEGLAVREVVATCSARLVAARAARVLLRDEIGAVVERLRTRLEEA
jgi:ATP phosphoribosyltransferase